MAVAYRPEIDGLRAIAVLPVIAYHAGASWMPGGYVGVDVFFVISGYLITSILMRELDAGSYSLAGFYARRARRILPALLVVCLASSVAAYCLMTPNHLIDFGESLLATLAFVSNFHFWQESGYFASASELKPLLHTWSLAIEEQFYILFPLFLAAMWRRGRKLLVPVLALVWVLSFAIAVLAGQVRPEANFYLLPGRAFELATGALIALVPVRAAVPAIWRTIGAGLGLAAIALAVVLFSAATPFPGPATLVPVFGTGLVIAFADRNGLVGRLLSLGPLVQIGLLSYSAYLWHWPLFVFAKLWAFQGGPMPNYVALSLLTFILAYLSWRWIETPFRRATIVPDRTAWIGLGTPVLALLAMSTVFSLTGGLQQLRTSPQVERLQASATFSPYRATCHTAGRNYRRAAEACAYFVEDPKWAVFGDSHTVELGYALARALETRGEGVSHHSFSNCAPMSGRSTERSACANWTDETLDHLMQDEAITTVVVTYRIHNYLWGDHLAHYPTLPSRYSEARRDRVWMAYLDAVQRLKSAGKQVILLLQPPELPAPVDYMLQRPANAAGDIEGIDRAWWEARQAWVTARLDQVPNGVILVDPTPLFCDSAMCRVSEDDTFFYFDENHLSVAGQARVAEHILVASGRAH